MEQWWRSWHNAPTDAKWLSVARRAGVVPGVVSAIAWSLLDYASQHPDRGSIAGFDPESYADWSGFDEATVVAVIQAIRDKGVLTGDHFTEWDKRQPKREDSSAERMRRHRERQGDNVTQGDAEQRNVTQGDAEQRNVTLDQIRSEEIRSDTDLLTTSNDVVEDPAPLPSSGLEETKTKPKAKSPASVTADAGKPKANARGAASPYKDHPAVLAYRDTHNRWPQAGQMKLIAESNPPIGDWVRALTTWTARGYNPNNIEGVLEWAHNPAQMERPKPTPERNKQNGSDPRYPQQNHNPANGAAADYYAELASDYANGKL